MKEQAQIYKSALRFKSQDEALRRLSVFNFEEYSDDEHKPFGKLIAFNEETLEPKHKIYRHVVSDTEIVIIPLAGAVLYTDSLGNEDIVETEQIRIFSANDGMTYTLENPYGEDLINYLQIWIEPSKNTDTVSTQRKFSYPGKNNLFRVFSSDKDDNAILVRQDAHGFLGIFETNAKETYKLSNPKNGLFAFAINGAFNFDGHRIEKNDALALSGFESVRFEALSENSLVLLIEIAL